MPQHALCSVAWRNEMLSSSVSEIFPFLFINVYPPVFSSVCRTQGKEFNPRLEGEGRNPRTYAWLLCKLAQVRRKRQGEMDLLS